MNTPTVSVVMSVLNGERFLIEAIESILLQTFTDFEFIIINDGSTDGTAAILEGYLKTDPRVRVYHQSNRGLVESLNRGCGLARGKYIARMDGDDIALPDRLLQQTTFMNDHPNVGVLGGAVEFVDTNGHILTVTHNPETDSSIRSALLQGDCPFWHPSTLIRRDMLLAVGGYRSIVPHAEDHDLWLRLADFSKLANLREVVLQYRLHPHQVTVRRYREMSISNLVARAAADSRRETGFDPLDSAKTVTPEMLSKLKVSERQIRAMIASRMLWNMRTMCSIGDYTAAMQSFEEAIASSDWRYGSKRVISDIHLIGARLYWRYGRFARSLGSVARAVITRPLSLGRPFKRLLTKSVPIY